MSRYKKILEKKERARGRERERERERETLLFTIKNIIKNTARN